MADSLCIRSGNVWSNRSNNAIFRVDNVHSKTTNARTEVRAFVQFVDAVPGTTSATRTESAFARQNRLEALDVDFDAGAHRRRNGDLLDVATLG